MLVEDIKVKEDAAKILLVEDHASFRQALAFMFEREPEFTVTAQAGSVAEARELVDGADVAVVDLGLPDGDGIELVEEFSSGMPSVATLVLSASLEPAKFASAVEAGAAGILHKSASITEIVDSVRRLKAGEALISANEMVQMLRVVSRKRQEELEARKAVEKLTRREREVLQALGKGLNSKEIAQKLHITVETERTHMVNILNKLGVHSRLQALVFALRNGAIEIH